MSAAANVLRESMKMADFCINAYLADLTDRDLLVRPTAGANHIAWQIGHIIKSENQLIEAVCPGAMPPLPAGFAERYTKETAASDEPSAFDSKAELLRVMAEQRAGTLAALDKLTDAQLDAPAPESIRQYCPTVGATFALQATHWFMHSGQWVIVRRILGRPPLF